MPECPAVARTECGSLRVPLFHADPGGRTIDVGYALMRHRDTSLPAARGTVAINPGGPGAGVASHAYRATSPGAGPALQRRVVW